MSLQSKRVNPHTGLLGRIFTFRAYGPALGTCSVPMSVPAATAFEPASWPQILTERVTINAAPYRHKNEKPGRNRAQAIITAMGWRRKTEGLDLPSWPRPVADPLLVARLGIPFSCHRPGRACAGHRRYPGEFGRVIPLDADCEVQQTGWCWPDDEGFSL